MNPRISGLLIFIIVAATFVTGVIVYPHLPAASRFGIAFAMPAIFLVLSGIWALLPRIDPLNKGFVGFRHVYDFVWILLTALLAYAYALTLETNLGIQVDVFPLVMRALGALFFVVGLLLPMIKRNWFFGIRTPWTISSDEVWRKTHRLGGALFALAGAILLAASFFATPRALGLGIGAVIAAALVSIVYSYLIYQHKK